MKLDSKKLLGFGAKAEAKNDTMIGTKGGDKKPCQPQRRTGYGRK